MPRAVHRVIGWWVWWLLAMVCAPCVVTMLLIVPSVMSSYGFLDFARMRYSIGCCFLLFFSFAWVVFLGLVSGVGVWFVVIADLYMLAALWGVPHQKLLGNKLDVGAYTTLRFLCQGVVHALPSALISTAAIDALLPVAVTPGPGCSFIMQLLWASLLLSMSRFAWEVISLAVLTHRLRAHCFVTAIVDVVHHLQPEQPRRYCEGTAPPGLNRPLSVVSERGLDGHEAQAGLASPDLGHALGRQQGPSGTRQQAKSVLTDRKAAPVEIQEMPAGQVEQPAGEIVAVGPAGAVPAQTAVQLHSSPSGTEGASSCRSCGGWACWPQKYPKFTVVYVWVLVLLVGAFVSVVCSHIIWPWLYVRKLDYILYKNLPAAAVQPYSLQGLWVNWKLSGSMKGSVAALGSCDVRDITCNLTAI
jgi:hypothetical protein